MPTEPTSSRHYTLALRSGTLLDGTYSIAQVLNDTSAFAVTYLALNVGGGDPVVIKEFLPRTLAGRARDELTVHAHSPTDEATLARVLRRFKREAELLADVAHPNIPRVRNCFEANGTAYVVLQHYAGRTLAELAAQSDAPLAPDRAAGLILQVLQGLEALHAEGIIHGFITPESVLVDDNSRSLILGLGTTRHVVGGAREPAAGFAPIEQYAAKEVGPWTDVYACAAVLYRLTTGIVPPSAIDRSTGQTLAVPWTAADVPVPLAHTIMSALAQLPDARPHSAEEFRRRLEASLSPGSRATSRVEPRLPSARWSTPEPATPAPVAAAPQPDAAADTPRFDYDAFLENSESPTERVRRLFRMVLGIGGATAALLLAVSILGSRKDDGSAGGDVIAAPAPAPRTPATRGEPPRVERPTPAHPVADLRATRSPDGAPRQAGAALARASRDEDNASARARSTSAPARTSAISRSGGASDNAPVTGVVPSVSLSLPASVGSFELLPSEVLAGLRERLAHGKENLESGEYARAGQIYRAALDQIETLNERYAGRQALVVVKRDLEQAAQRALAACAAENEVAAKRNAAPVQCQ